MNKKERTELINNANKDFGRPFIVEANDDQGETKYGLIQTDQDERTFINFAARNRNWFARDLKK